MGRSGRSRKRCEATEHANLTLSMSKDGLSLAKRYYQRRRGAKHIWICVCCVMRVRGDHKWKVDNSGVAILRAPVGSDDKKA